MRFHENVVAEIELAGQIIQDFRMQMPKIAVIPDTLR